MSLTITLIIDRNLLVIKNHPQDFILIIKILIIDPHKKKDIEKLIILKNVMILKVLLINILNLKEEFSQQKATLEKI